MTRIKLLPVDDQFVYLGYRKLKSFVYYDKTDLCLRRRLAEFECDPAFKTKLHSVMNVVNSEEPINEPLFKSWLEQISFRAVPKSFEEKENSSLRDSGNFMSNVTSAKVYRIAKINYFFDGPIELHLLAVLWIMLEGWRLDSQLGKESYGSRLDDRVGQADDRSARLFRKYHELYARWRDSGIRKAKQMLTEEQTSVGILGLDVQEYYYRIRIDFHEIAHSVQEARREKADIEEHSPESGQSSSNLLACLEAICRTYRGKIDPFLQLTHKDPPPLDTGIPIGLCTSPLIANWYLRNFDKAIMSRVRPASYGRYVDDILMVLPAPKDLANEEHPVTTFMDRVLVQAGILRAPQDKRYEIVEPGGLFLQQDKCILQYFDAKHSIAGLEKFQKKLEENGSDFLLLPVDEADNSLEDVAYDLLYEGSVNKFRNVKGLAENRYELAKHLARQTILHLLTDDSPDPKISRGLRQFFKGKNAIEFHDLWERVFTFFLIANDTKAAHDFAKQLQAEIKRVRFPDQPPITHQLRSNLEAHLELSQAMADALVEAGLQKTGSEQFPKSFFRRANLIRHHFVRMPLLNYTDYSGSLAMRSLDELVKTDPRKLELSPRYVNFDECMLLAKSGDIDLGSESAFQWAAKIYKEANRHETQGMKWDSIPVAGEVSDDSL